MRVGWFTLSTWASPWPMSVGRWIGQVAESLFTFVTGCVAGVHLQHGAAAQWAVALSNGGLSRWKRGMIRHITVGQCGLLVSSCTAWLKQCVQMEWPQFIVTACVMPLTTGRGSQQSMHSCRPQTAAVVMKRRAEDAVKRGGAWGGAVELALAFEKAVARLANKEAECWLC